MGYFTWHTTTGRASYCEMIEVPCPYTGGSHKTCTDEYDTRHYCTGGCRGTGTVRVPRYTHVPEFDAPQPPLDFQLESHKHEISDNIYFGGAGA